MGSLSLIVSTIYCTSAPVEYPGIMSMLSLKVFYIAIKLVGVAIEVSGVPREEIWLTSKVGSYVQIGPEVFCRPL